MRRLRLALLLAIAILPACNSLPAMSGRESEHQQTLYVASYTRTCTGMYEMQCMLVKENASDEWGNFYDVIEGFTPEPGYEYEFVVGWREIPNPPADGSSRAYRLVRMVSRKRVLSGG